VQFIFNSCSTFIGQVSLPCIRQLLTQVAYTMPSSFNVNHFPVRMGRYSRNSFGRLEILVLPSIFDTNLSRCETCRVIQQQFWMWHSGGEVKTCSDPSYIFSGGLDPLPLRISAPVHNNIPVGALQRLWHLGALQREGRTHRRYSLHKWERDWRRRYFVLTNIYDFIL